jgi:hypothetical protein
MNADQSAELVKQRRTALAADAIARQLPPDADIARDRWLLSDRGRDVGRILFVQPTLETVAEHKDLILAAGDVGDGLPSWIEIDAQAYVDHEISKRLRLTREDRDAGNAKRNNESV